MPYDADEKEAALEVLILDFYAYVKLRLGDTSASQYRNVLLNLLGALEANSASDPPFMYMISGMGG